MKQPFIIVLVIFAFSIVFNNSCKKKEEEEEFEEQEKICICDYPFYTDNPNIEYLAVTGHSFIYNNECWTYVGQTRNGASDPKPPDPANDEPDYWAICTDSVPSCECPNEWAPGIHKVGSIVSYNGKCYIAFDDADVATPGSAEDRAWAVCQ